MLYQPSYPSPYLSDVDISIQNEFSCYINADGGTKVVGYKYSIKDLNGNTILANNYTPLANPIYANEVLYFDVPASSNKMSNGLDYTWNITLYEENPDIWVVYGTIQSGDNTAAQLCLRANFLIEAGMYIKINNQLVRINTYEKETGIATLSSPLSSVPTVGTQYNIYSNNLTSNDFYFRARTTAKLNLATIPSVIDSKLYTFSATYTQAENVGFKYYEWTIYNQAGSLISTSGTVNSGKIEYTFDGFINGNTYGVGLVLENQDGEVLSVTPQYFSVSYALPELNNAPTATVNCEKSAIDLTWSPLLINQGKAIADQTGTTPHYNIINNEPFYGGSSVDIEKGTNLSWYVGSKETPVYVPYESTTFFHWHTNDPNFEGLGYRQEGEYYDLISISSVAPLNPSVGDKYYNSDTKLIYTAVANGVWGSNGVSPSEGIIYRVVSGSSQNKYVWSNNELTGTDYSLPYYQITYKDSYFHYEISNGDIHIENDILVYIPKESWLLQPKSAFYPNIYVWKDDEAWDDSLYYQVNTDDFITKYWFKFTLLPNKVLMESSLITGTTWAEARQYTWEQVSQYTWEYLKMNKI